MLDLRAGDDLLAACTVVVEDLVLPAGADADGLQFFCIRRPLDVRDIVLTDHKRDIRCFFFFETYVADGDDVRPTDTSVGEVKAAILTGGRCVTGAGRSVQRYNSSASQRPLSAS